MSGFRVTPEHIPSIKKWTVPEIVISQKLSAFGFQLLYPRGVHNWYSYTDVDGSTKLLPDLILASSLYKKDAFTCINYAFKVWNECSRRYSINTWVPVIGKIPDIESRHAWILIMLGDENGLDLNKFLYFEPNDGWEMGAELEMTYQAFPIGKENYKGEMIFY